MPYTINVVVVGATAGLALKEGALSTVLDTPPECTLDAAGRSVSGIRYLIGEATTNGDTDAFRLVHIPSEFKILPTIRVADEAARSLQALLLSLIATSPVRTLVFYLESNRGLSRPTDPGDVQFAPHWMTRTTIHTFVEVVRGGNVVQDAIWELRE